VNDCSICNALAGAEVPIPTLPSSLITKALLLPVLLWNCAVNVEEVVPAPCTWSLDVGVVVPIPTLPSDFFRYNASLPTP